jgi:hypothetical protein
MVASMEEGSADSFGVTAATKVNSLFTASCSSSIREVMVNMQVPIIQNALWSWLTRMPNRFPGLRCQCLVIAMTSTWDADSTAILRAAALFRTA